MKTTETKIVKIADIKVGERKRQVDLEKLKPLKDSIKNIGLIHPIILNLDLKLIAGNHRLEATKALGKTEILAIIGDINELQAELIEIDENLVRKSLTTLERAEQIARRKELYEQLHPEATKKEIVKKNLAKRKDSGLQDETDKPTKTFVEDTAEQTGMSKRSIQQSIQNANNIIPEAKEKIKGTPLVDKTTALTRIAKAEPEKQLDIVDEELEKLNKPKRVKAESKAKKAPVQITLMQAEPVNATDSQSLEKELDVAYKVDFVLRKVAVDGKWLDLPPEYNMDNNSYNHMADVAKNYVTTKGNNNRVLVKEEH